jgi:DNA repair exonuclease SbcCD ATPase subunit
MYFTRIELENFQKHKHLVVDLTDKVNVLWGESDAGKSCIIRAITWVVYNEPKKDVRRQGSDMTTVKLHIDSGVIIERQKSDSVNAYVIHQGGEKKRLDAIGKAVPDEVMKILGMSPMVVGDDSIMLNVSSQMEPPFLLSALSASSTFRMKIFNKLTGNDLLDAVAQSFNKDALRLNREKAMLESTVGTKEKDRDIIAKALEGKTERRDGASFILTKLEGRIKAFRNINALAEQLTALNREWKSTEDRLKLADIHL